MSAAGFHSVEGWVAIESWKVENLSELAAGDYVSPFFTTTSDVYLQKVDSEKPGALQIERVSPAYLYFKVEVVVKEKENG